MRTAPISTLPLRPTAVELALKWAEIGLSEAPADRARAEVAFKGLYAMAGLPAPTVIWRPDPLSGLSAVIEMIAGARKITPASVTIRPSRRTPPEARRPHVGQLRLSMGTVRDLIVGALENRLLDSLPILSGLRLSLVNQPFLARPSRLSTLQGDLASIGQLYAILDRRQPEDLAFKIYEAGEIEATRSVRLIRDFRARSDITIGLMSCFWGSLRITVEPLLDWADLAAGLEQPATDPLREAARSVGMFWTLPDVCVATERPRAVHHDRQGRLHNPAGSAAEYRSGWGLYRWHGVTVPQWIITNPDRITVRDIETEENAEIRRVLIERYGQERYLVNSGAQEVHRDDFGILYRKILRGDEPLVMVKVVNATPEPDGTFKDYYLRVPPTMRMAREAVAWTFGKTAATYIPEAQT